MNTAPWDYLSIVSEVEPVSQGFLVRANVHVPDGTYRVTLTPTEPGPAPEPFIPSWDNAPAWAMWAAQRPDGSWRWFEVKPCEGHNPYWRTLSGNAARIKGSTGTPNPNWRDTLQERPEPEMLPCAKCGCDKIDVMHSDACEWRFWHDCTDLGSVLFCVGVETREEAVAWWNTVNAFGLNAVNRRA